MTMEARGSRTRPSTSRIGSRDGSNRLSSLDMFRSQIVALCWLSINAQHVRGKRVKIRGRFYINPYRTDFQIRGKWRYKVSEEKNVIDSFIETMTAYLFVHVVTRYRQSRRVSVCWRPPASWPVPDWWLCGQASREGNNHRHWQRSVFLKLIVSVNITPPNDYLYTT